jgi:SUMO ligase MMS21 Smc5/6 complex component
MSTNSHSTRRPIDIVRTPSTFRESSGTNHSTNSRDVCKHSFSGGAIREYLSQGVKKCPAAGCNKKITLEDLKEDRALERRVKEHARREAMRAEDEDVDAEIID